MLLMLVTPSPAPDGTVLAAAVNRPVPLDAAHPAKEWDSATPIAFLSDWQGKHADPGRQTEVRLLWNPDTLYLRFVCRYRTLHVFSDSSPNGRRDQLWDRDVAEAFLQPDPARLRHYKEFEIAPNGMWIDLEVSPGPLADLQSGLQRSVFLDAGRKTWLAELAIPMRAFTADFDPHSAWRANFYRIEGDSEPRAYLAWRPTNTAQPNFHVPSAFGTLRFAPARPR